MSTVSLQRQVSSGYASSSEDSRSPYGKTHPAPLAAHLRPTPKRRETDQILSYYQSELAGRSYVSSDVDDNIAPPSLVRKVSSVSGSSSEYSSGSLDHPVDALSHRDYDTAVRKQPPIETRHTRRPSAPSEGGADRRRLAIVELDSTSQSSLDRKLSQKSRDARMEGSVPVLHNGLLKRRGLQVDSLALVAPPDAAPNSYTDLTPPTAPLPADRAITSWQSTLHQRSMSEAVNGVGASRLHHKHSRDVGIVGIAVTASESSTASVRTSDEFQTYADNEGLQPPVFQTPGRSPATTPGATTPELSDSGEYQYSSASLTTPNHDGQQPMLTPAIGEYKDIQQPVVGPVVVGLSSHMMHRDPSRTHTTVSSPTGATSARVTPSPNYFSHTTSPYLHYEPGKHSTAGPLPPPPQLPTSTIPTPASSAPPPRPPRLFTPLPSGPKRDIEALKEALQLPKSVSAALASRLPLESANYPRSDSLPSSSTPSDEDEKSPPATTLRPSKSIHTREGAFPPSTICASPPSVMVEVSETSNDSVKAMRHLSEDSPVLVEAPGRGRGSPQHEREASSSASSISSVHTLQEPPRRTTLELRRESSWVSLGKDVGARPMSPNGGAEPTSSSPTSSSHVRSPPVPPKNGRSSEDERSFSSAPGAFKATLTNFKRFSALPRTPSYTSGLKASSPRVSRTPSPPTIAPVAFLPTPLPKPPRPRPKFRSAWPDAMQCSDVVAKKSSAERSVGYANKINELALYDCGLEDWVMLVKHRGSNSRSMQGRAMQLMVTPATPSMRTHTSQPRHTSHGSMRSEATFPIRPDAYTATDLSVRYTDITSDAQSPALPYPSLAQSSRTLPMRASPSRSLQLPLPGSKPSGQGFFASIGRKSSVKKDKTPSAPSRVLTKRTPSSTPANPPRPVPIPAAPSVPGGPRAAPGRMHRSQTFSVSPSQPAPESAPPPSMSRQRQSAIGRRPSLFARARGAPSGPVQPAAPPTPEFEQQVDKLADLLPHADRAVLAGYLRRAGQDILAIGQYLDDEKNGTLRRE